MKKLASLFIACILALTAISCSPETSKPIEDNKLNVILKGDVQERTEIISKDSEYVIPFGNAVEKDYALMVISIGDRIVSPGEKILITEDTEIVYKITDGTPGFKFDTNSELGLEVDTQFNGTVYIPESIDGQKIVKTVRNIFARQQNITKVVFPYGIECIDTSAFEQCTQLNDIFLPESLKTTGSCLFNDCTSLESIRIPSKITILNQLFQGCTNLKEVILPTNITEIGFQCFKDCTSLTSISLPNGLEIINEQAFAGCSSLREITIPSSVTNILPNAFYGCTNLTKIYLENGTDQSKWSSKWKGNCTAEIIELPAK